MIKKILSAALVILMTALFALPLFGASSGEAIEAVERPKIQNVGAACVYNIENERYIYDHNSDKVIYPASTVKLMTAILTVEKYGSDLSHEISVHPEAVYLSKNSNRIYLTTGEILTVEQLLYGLVCGGANDAAYALAIDIGGSVDGFVDMMNKRAAELGARNTHYTNPSGLHDDEMVTTAKDTALIASYAYGLSPICEIATAEKYVIPATEGKCSQHTVNNNNYYYNSIKEWKYIWRLEPTPRGLNAGSTKEGGYCVVTTMARDGLSYIIVVMDAERIMDPVDPDNPDNKTYTYYSYTEAAKLAKWAIKAYSYTKVLTTSDMICEVPVKLSSKVDYITLFPAKNVELFLPADIDLEKDLKMTWTLTKDYFTAPISEGEVAGTLSLSYDGTPLGTYDLVTRNSVNRDNILYVADIVGDALKSRPFKIIVTVVIIGFVGYVGVLVYMTVKASRKRKQ